MSFKRSRDTFENDHAPYVFYGTPLPQYDPEVRDDGSYVPVWRQEVRDERGRKRLHGAFTGGFSAGYFNTVGSKEGWTPSTFVSSRTNRAAKQPVPQRPEDFMDEEDLAEAAEAEKLKTADTFTGLGLTEDDTTRKRTTIFTDSITSRNASMGVKLLQKMGWRLGQGLGPRVRRKARTDDDDDERGHAEGDGETHLFAPENSKVMTYTKKVDTKGLGYTGEAQSLADTVKDQRDEDDDDDDRIFKHRKSKISLAKPASKKSGFGVGILNDTGSDDEDPYAIGPKISYHRTIGGAKKSKKADRTKAATTAANPLLRAKPVFLSKKAPDRAAGFRKCHDGRLPLKGFLLAVHPYVPGKVFSRAQIPEGWTSSRQGIDAVPSATAPHRSLRDAAKASTLDPTARAALLGETALPGKSIFDYISPAARDRLAAISGRTDLPAAKGEAPPAAHRTTESDPPPLDRESALAALAGGTPYADDPAKRARYRAFLERAAGRTEGLPERPADLSPEDHRRELYEFARAARVFRPMTGMMAARFTSSSRAVEGPGDVDEAGDGGVLREGRAVASDPAEEAARMGLFGPMTRSEGPFYPTRLLCKRFGVPPPDTAGGDAADVGGGADATTSNPVLDRSLELVSRAAMEKMMRESAASGGAAGLGEATMVDVPAPAAVDVERNDALEGERPGDAVFRAIFGNDDDDDEE